MSSNPLIKYLIKIKYLNPALLDDKIRINQIMRKLLAISTSLIIIIFCSSCDNDFDFEISSGNLSFSKDTVYLDTVFTNIGSSTYNLKVYNNSNDNILIPNINLGNGENSYYRLNVDGIYGSDSNAGKYFENIELLANDSLYIFIETTVDIEDLSDQSTQFLYTDHIQFNSGENQQKVDLVTLVKDAVFIYPQRYLDSQTNEYIVETLSFDIDGDGANDETDIEGRFLNVDELNFTSERPYVIYGYAAVPENELLIINPGSRIHFHANSGLIVTNGASIKINGEFSLDQEALENEVIFEGDRLEPIFEDVPGQWGTIWLFDGSINNEINYTTIKNSSIGLYLSGDFQENQEKLLIKNSKIYNSSNFGILAKGSSIKAENIVINNSGQSSFAATYGGKYSFTHSTITNYWNSGFRQFPALLLNNYLIDSEGNTLNNEVLEAYFNNCIIYGSQNIELLVEQLDDSNLDYKFSNCLLKFSDINNSFNTAIYDFENQEHFENLILNDDPYFLDPYENNMIIGINSAAINQGNQVYSSIVPFDLLNVDRTNNPDLGAYQHIIQDD